MSNIHLNARFQKRQFVRRNSDGQLEAVVEITRLTSDVTHEHPIKIICDVRSLLWRSSALEAAVFNLDLDDGADFDEDGNVCFDLDEDQPPFAQDEDEEEDDWLVD